MLLHEILLSSGERNYKWFTKMFNLWSLAMFNKQIDINNDSITEYFKDFYSYKTRFYEEIISVEVNFLYLLVLKTVDDVFHFRFIYKENNNYQLHSHIKKDMLKFNYYLDGIRQRKYNKNSV